MKAKISLLAAGVGLALGFLVSCQENQAAKPALKATVSSEDVTLLDSRTTDSILAQPGVPDSIPRARKTP